MKIKQFGYFFLIILFCNSCGSDSFYEGYKVEDIWRLPLIKPYVLRNTLDPSRGNNKGIEWGLMFQKSVTSATGSLVEGINVLKINVKDSIIFGYGQTNPGYPFIIDTKHNKEMIFETREKWSRKLDSFNIESSRVSDIEPLFEDFKNKHFLPWHQP